MLNKVADGEKPIKWEKRNKDTASNKKPRKSWNHPKTALQTPKEVSQIMEKKNIHLPESSRCNEVWFAIRKQLVKYRGKKTKKLHK